MRKSILVLCSAIWSSNVFALTLDQALVKAYEYHDDQKIIRQDFLSQIEAFPEALAAFMPKITATISTFNEKKAEFSNAGNLLRTPDGSGYKKIIRLEQSIFNGGASVANLKAAQSSFLAYRGYFYIKEQETILAEIQAYLDLATASEKYIISDTSVKSNLKQLEAIKERARLGEATKTDIASAESGFATAVANKLAAQSEHETAKNNFTKIFGVEDYNITMPNLPSNLPENLDQLISKALTLSPSLEYVKHSAASSRASEYASKGAIMPNVSLGVSYGEDLVGFPGTNLNNRTAIKTTTSTTTTLSVNIPILSRGGAEYSAIRKSKNQSRKLAIQLEQQTKQINTECKSSWENFLATKSKLAATEQAVTAAEIAYDGMSQEEKLGSKTILDVLTAEERLNKAREQNLSAKKELIILSYKLKSLTGDLTAKSLKLPVTYFEPEQEFKKIKFKVIGF